MIRSNGHHLFAGNARNDNALATVKEWNDKHRGEGHITLPYLADEKLVERAVDGAFGGAA